MKSRIIQYLLIIIILSGLTGGWFYFSSNAAQKINSSKVNNLTSGLVGYWTFDGADTTTATASDKNPTATKYNGAITNATPDIGKMGQALNFNGSSTKVDVTGFTQAIVPPFTFSAWIKLNSVPGALKRIAYKDGSLGMNVNSTAVYCGDANWGGGPSMTQSWVVGQWYHVACVISASDFTGAGQSIYVNGSNSGSASDGWYPSDNGTSLKIGSNGSGAYFDGKIDEPRIYNRALSASEITELYQQGQTRINASQTNKLTNGLVGYWTMDGGNINWGDASTEIKDQSVSAKHGNAVNMTTANAAMGKVGQGLSFNGSNNYIEIPDTGDAYDFGTGPFAISYWAKCPDAGGYLFMKENDADCSGGGGSGFCIYCSSTGVGRMYYTGIGDYLIGDTANAWHYFTIVRSGTGTGQTSFYYDGAPSVLNPTGTESRNLTNSYPLRIGTSNDFAWSYFPGALDEVRIYNRALSQSEITELYQQGQTKINVSQDGKLENGLVAYYTMDGQDMAWATATTGTVSDKSPSGINTGTLTNMSQSTSPVIGKIGQGLYFDGSNDYIVKTGATGLPQGNNSFSISVWTKPAKGAANYMVSWGYPNYGNNLWNAFVVTGSKLYHLFYGNDLPGGTTLIVNGSTWYHAVVTYDKDTNLRKIYLNGTVDASAVPSNGTPAVDGSELLIATDPVGDFIGKGTLDEVRVYNRSLSASEVTELYNMGR